MPATTNAPATTPTVKNGRIVMPPKAPASGYGGTGTHPQDSDNGEYVPATDSTTDSKGTK